MKVTTTLKVDEKRLLAYAVAAGAVLAAAGPADASVVYGKVGYQLAYNEGFYPVNIVDKVGNKIFAMYFVNSDALTAGHPANVFHSNAFAMFPGLEAEVNVGAMLSVNGNAASKLTRGDAVGGGGSFATGPSLFQIFNVNGPNKTYGNFLQGADGYLGFSIPAGNGSNNFGWVHLDNFTVAPNASSYRVVDWAYQNNGTAILAGEGATAVPEPTSSALALIAMGAAGLAIYRKRKQDAQA